MRLLPVRAVAAGLLVAGCFSDAPAPTGPAAPLAAAVAGSATANTFSPQTVTIAKNGTVTWTVSTRPHNVTFVAATGAPANVPTGTNFEVARTFPEVGTYAYACTLHAGMIGTVVVREH